MERPTTPPPEDIARELARRLVSPSALDASPLPLPGDAWERRLLVALAAHLPRQRWVADVVERHLSASPTVIASAGAFGHPEEIPQEGTVPTLPEWSYYFHGCGCCLTHTDGTSIDVDFDKAGAEGIDPYFYDHYVKSLPMPSGIEALLRRPEPFSTSWMADLDGLRDLGFIDGNHRFKITELGLRWAAAIGPALQELVTSHGQRRYLLATLLDEHALAVEGEDLTDGPLAAATDAAIATRAAKLAWRVEKKRSAPALVGLASLGRPWADALMRKTLTSQVIDILTASAIELVERRGDSIDDELLVVLAQRAASPNPPEPYVRSCAVEIVLERYRADTLPQTLRAQLISLLRDDGYRSEASIARHIYLLDPAEGLSRLSRALHHHVPLVRYQSAASLAVIGTAEAAELLRAAGTEESKAALAIIRGIAPSPGPEPVGEIFTLLGRPRRVFTFDEIEAASLPGWVTSDAKRLSETFGPLLERWWAS